MAKYEIALIDCAFYAHHGLYEEEKRLGQRFFVDVIMQVNSPHNLEDDKIEGTVDYGKAFKHIEKIVLKKRKNLIEALALEIAKSLCKKFKTIESVQVSIRKPNAPIDGVLETVEVSLVYPQ